MKGMFVLVWSLVVNANTQLFHEKTPLSHQNPARSDFAEENPRPGSIVMATHKLPALKADTYGEAH